MMDIKFIRENPDIIKDAARKKGIDPEIVDELLSTDKIRRELMQAAEAIRAEQKKTKDREEGTRLKEKFKQLHEESRFEGIEKKFDELMALMPNIISSDTPIGKSDKDNMEIFHWDEPKKFDFTPKDHIALGTALDILDFEKGAKVGGFRGYYVKNDGVLLMMGIMMYAMHKMVEKDIAPMIPPTFVRGLRAFWERLFQGS